MPEIKVVISADNKSAIEAIQQVLTASKKASDGVDAVGGNGNVTVAKEGVMSLAAALNKITKAANSASEAIERAGKNMADSMNKAGVSTKSLNNALGKTVSAAKATTAAIKETGTGTTSSLSGAATKANLLAAALGRVSTAAKGAGSSAGVTFAAGESSAGSFMLSLGKLTAVIATVTAGLYTMKELLAPGFKYTMDIDSAKLGIAGTIQAMTKLNGEAVDFGTAMSISSGMMKQLQRDAALTAATTEDLVKVFQSIMAPGLAAGMSLDEIRQLTTTGAAAVKAIMPGNADAQRQMVQEIRDLVQGGIQASSSTLATALGITDADIDRAKNSSDGLFKFLMERLKGYNDAATHYTDELPGKIDVLKETATRASAEFTEEFKDELKDLLDYVTNVFGTIDKETGEFKFSDNLQAVFNEVKSDYAALKDFFKDESTNIGSSFDDITKGAKDFWQSIKNIGSILGDMARVASPVFNFFAEGFRDLMNDVKEITGYLKEAWDWWAKIAGRKNSQKVDTSTDNGMADFTKMQDTNKQPSAVDTSGLTKKFEDNKKLVEQSQEAMKIALSAIKHDAEIAKERNKAEQEALDVQYKQQQIGEAEYFKKRTQLEAEAQQIAVDKAQASLDVVRGTMFDKDSTKNEKVAEYENEVVSQTEKLKKFGDALTEVTAGAVQMGKQGATWNPETGGVDIGNLNSVAVNAIDALSAYYQELTGKAMVVSSGYRDWGGHVSGNKFDVVDDMDSTMLEKNEGGIRDKIIAYAEKLGLAVLDEYVNPSRNATAGHLDFDASGFNGNFQAQATARFKSVLTKTGLEYQKAVLALFKEADEVASKLSESTGDVSSTQKAAIAYKYNELIKKFAVNGMTEAVKMTEKLKANEMRNIDFAQVQKDVEIANSQLAEEQRIMLNQLALGTKSAADIVNEFGQINEAVLGSKLKQLRKLLSEYMAAGDWENVGKVQAQINSIKSTAAAFLETVLRKIDDKLQYELNMIEADKGLTSYEKEERSNEAKRQAYLDNAAAARKNAEDIRSQGGNEIDAQAADRLAAYNERLAQMADYLYDVKAAGKEAFADGLFNWMTEGIQKAQTFGDAIREMAISILSDMNKIFSRKVTANLMAKWGFAGGGYVSGPGTGTSDSVDASLSHGEYVIKAASVQKFGAAFFHMLNSGIMPPSFAFADGGYVDVGGGAADIAGSFQAGDQNIRVVNVTDPNEVGRFLTSSAGEKVFVNVVQKYAGTLRRILK